MLQRILWRRGGSPPASLAPCLVETFLRHPWSEPGLNSHVWARTDGTIGGFVGALPVRMSHRGRPLLAAAASSAMVDAPADNPHVGARLMRAFLQGPQELSISETASEAVRRMWLALGATPLPAHSLDWGVVLRPASFLAFLAALRLPPLRHLARAAALVDAPSARLARIPWRAAPPPDGVFGADAALEEFAALLPEGLAHLPLRPDFDRPALLWLVTQAARKERRGALVCRIVRDRRGRVAGGYLGHFRQRGLMRVVQMFTVPARAEAVVDEMLAHAREFGAVAVMGRSRPEAPALMGALELRRALFLCASGFSLVHSCAPELAEAVARGEGCVTGLAGEAWVRVIDGEFA